MNALTPDQYHKAEEDFKIVLGMCKGLISTEATNDVEHYLNHAELEMAYESMGLSLKAESINLPRAAREILYTLGLKLGLDKESVLNVNFWAEVSPILKP